MTYSIEAYNYIRTGSQAGGHVLVKESNKIKKSDLQRHIDYFVNIPTCDMVKIYRNGRIYAKENVVRSMNGRYIHFKANQ